MSQLKLKEAVTIADVVAAVRDGASIDDYCLYGKDSEDTVAESSVCFIDSTPSVDNNDTEIYPAFARQNGLQLLYYGQQFADVIGNAKRQRPDADLSTYVRALNHYLENDDFIDL
jgi:hypothetical protein